MNKTLRIFVVAVAFVIPFYAHASWWNPTTWNKSNESSLEQKFKDLEKKLADFKPVTSTPVETAVSGDSELKDKVTSLLKENESLKAQIKTLTAKVASLEAKPSSVVTNTPEPKKDDLPKVEIISKISKNHDSTEKGNSSFKATLRVYAGTRPIYIPFTTTSSPGPVIGITYEPTGSFEGTQTARITCQETKLIGGINNCYVASSSKADINVTVSLIPSKPGTYGVKLGKVGYSTRNDSKPEFDEGAKIYILDPIVISGDTEFEKVFMYKDNLDPVVR